MATKGSDRTCPGGAGREFAVSVVSIILRCRRRARRAFDRYARAVIDADDSMLILATGAAYPFTPTDDWVPKIFSFPDHPAMPKGDATFDVEVSNVTFYSWDWFFEGFQKAIDANPDIYQRLCPWPHYVEVLYGVPVTPVEELPKFCACGHEITYAEDLWFVEGDLTPPFGDVGEDVVLENVMLIRADNLHQECTMTREYDGRIGCETSSRIVPGCAKDYAESVASVVDCDDEDEED